MSVPRLVTFSGLDGAGKSTLIADLATHLRERGHRVGVLTMYDDVSLYSHLRRVRDMVRGTRGRAVAGSGALYSAVRSPAVRRIAFLGDLLSLLARRAERGLRGDDVLILDRYLYDTLADAAEGGGWPSIASLLRLAPVPDVPLLIDVEPEHAFARKGEYDLPYLAKRRAVYAGLFARIPGAVTVRNEDLGAAAAAVRSAVAERVR